MRRFISAILSCLLVLLTLPLEATGTASSHPRRSVFTSQALNPAAEWTRSFSESWNRWQTRRTINRAFRQIHRGALIRKAAVVITFVSLGLRTLTAHAQDVAGGLEGFEQAGQTGLDQGAGFLEWTVPFSEDIIVVFAIGIFVWMIAERLDDDDQQHGWHSGIAKETTLNSARFLISWTAVQLAYLLFHRGPTVPGPVPKWFSADLEKFQLTLLVVGLSSTIVYPLYKLGRSILTSKNYSNATKVFSAAALFGVFFASFPDFIVPLFKSPWLRGVYSWIHDPNALLPRLVTRWVMQPLFSSHWLYDQGVAVLAPLVLEGLLSTGIWQASKRIQQTWLRNSLRVLVGFVMGVQIMLGVGPLLGLRFLSNGVPQSIKGVLVWTNWSIPAALIWQSVFVSAMIGAGWFSIFLLAKVYRNRVIIREPAEDRLTTLKQLFWKPASLWLVSIVATLLIAHTSAPGTLRALSHSSYEEIHSKAKPLVESIPDDMLEDIGKSLTGLIAPEAVLEKYKNQLPQFGTIAVAQLLQTTLEQHTQPLSFLENSGGRPTAFLKYQGIIQTLDEEWKRRQIEKIRAEKTEDLLKAFEASLLLKPRAQVERMLGFHDGRPIPVVPSIYGVFQDPDTFRERRRLTTLMRRSASDRLLEARLNQYFQRWARDLSLPSVGTVRTYLFKLDPDETDVQLGIAPAATKQAA